MLRFNNDYNEGAHESILKKLAEINMNQIGGYGEDEYCDEARDIIKKLCDAPSADIHFLVGGTQTNLTVISSALRPYQCAVCASTGHINVHETGAIEATGHKVFAVPGSGADLCAARYHHKQVCDGHSLLQNSFPCMKLKAYAGIQRNGL